jgi:hypothetical protein
VYDHLEDALHVEALAIRDGMTLAFKAGATRIMVESDCISVGHMMKR